MVRKLGRDYRRLLETVQDGILFLDASYRTRTARHPILQDEASHAILREFWELDIGKPAPLEILRETGGF